jgi:hypothetical protein
MGIEFRIGAKFAGEYTNIGRFYVKIPIVICDMFMT